MLSIQKPRKICNLLIEPGANYEIIFDLAKDTMQISGTYAEVQNTYKELAYPIFFLIAWQVDAQTKIENADNAHLFG